MKPMKQSGWEKRQERLTLEKQYNLKDKTVQRRIMNDDQNPKSWIPSAALNPISQSTFEMAYEIGRSFAAESTFSTGTQMLQDLYASGPASQPTYQLSSPSPFYIGRYGGPSDITPLTSDWFASLRAYKTTDRRLRLDVPKRFLAEQNLTMADVMNMGEMVNIEVNVI